MTGTIQKAGGLSIEGVGLQIGEVRILEQVTIDVGAGQATGLIGANGSGKSSLLNVVSGYYRPSRGRVLVNGADTTGLRPERVSARGVGRSFQSIGRMQDLTVREYVTLGLEPVWSVGKVASLLFLPRSARAERRAFEKTDALTSDFGIDAYAQTMLRECPYGVRKIADLLRAVISEPSVLLLDEPTSGVAASDRRMISQLIAQWRSRSNCSIVLVDHDVSFVAGVVDEMVALSAGRVIDAGRPADVLANPQVMATFVGEGEVDA
jgi:branched-chain amino acid transport system ATP-binding protein